jgi:hypothetical protein
MPKNGFDMIEMLWVLAAHSGMLLHEDLTIPLVLLEDGQQVD